MASSSLLPLHELGSGEVIRVLLRAQPHSPSLLVHYRNLPFSPCGSTPLQFLPPPPDDSYPHSKCKVACSTPELPMPMQILCLWAGSYSWPSPCSPLPNSSTPHSGASLPKLHYLAPFSPSLSRERRRWVIYFGAPQCKSCEIMFGVWLGEGWNLWHTSHSSNPTRKPLQQQ